MGAYAPAIADDQQTADVERLHDLIRSALPDLPAHEGGYGPFHHRCLAESRAAEFPRAKSCIRFRRRDDLDRDALRARLEEAGRLPAPGAV